MMSFIHSLIHGLLHTHTRMYYKDLYAMLFDVICCSPIKSSIQSQYILFTSFIAYEYAIEILQHTDNIF